MTRPDEAEEWQAEILAAWIETYKKAMTTPVVLRLIAEHQPIAAGRLAELIPAGTGWDVTERGLYRTLKRLESYGLISHTTAAAARTGASRKDFSLTELGHNHLTAIEAQIGRSSAPPR